MYKWFVIAFAAIALVLFILGVTAVTVFIPPSRQITTTYDAVVIHGYWLSQKDNGPIGLSMRSAFAVKAAVALYRKNIARAFVIPAGPIWGPTFPSLGKIMAQELENNGVPKEQIIVIDTGMDTNEETAIFLDVAKQRQWKSLGDIAWARHGGVIQALYANTGARVDLLSVEDVINQFGSADDKKAISSFTHSFYEYDFALYEQLIRSVMLFDPKYQFLGQIAQRSRVKKSSNGGILFFPTDIFQL